MPSADSNNVIPVNSELIKWSKALTRCLEDGNRAADAKNALLAMRTLLEQGQLPQIQSAKDCIAQTPDEPEPIIEGMLRPGEKAIFSAESKAGKTWICLDLAISVAAGCPWLGLRTIQTKVCYINFELKPGTVTRRLNAICAAKGIPIPEYLSLWNLRGHSAPIEVIIDKLAGQIAAGGFGFIILDPIYKMLGARNENDNGQIAEFLSHFNRLTEELGVAVLVPHHFAKGDMSFRKSKDRGAGAGAFSRDFDSIISATDSPLEGIKDRLSIECDLRSLPRMAPFAVVKSSAIYVRDHSDAPVTPQTANATEKMRKMNECVAILKANINLRNGEWLQKCQESMEITKTTFDRYVRELVQSNRVKKENGMYCSIGRTFHAVQSEAA